MERRRSARRAIDASEPLSYARLRTGGELRVIDASTWGALAETRQRLLPGRHLDVHIVSSNGRVLVRARVTRAYVCRLQADAIEYRAGLAFDQGVDIRQAEHALAVAEPVGTADRGRDYPVATHAGEIEFAERLSA